MIALVCLALFIALMICIFTPRLALPLVALLIGGVFLSGCAQLGISQSQSEATYTTAAIGADVALQLGKLTGDAVDQICKGDRAAYTILVATRNPADGVKSYAPADNAHAKLQNDGVKLSGDCQAIP